jgi:hypothetical protein
MYEILHISNRLARNTVKVDLCGNRFRLERNSSFSLMILLNVTNAGPILPGRQETIRPLNLLVSGSFCGSIFSRMLSIVKGFSQGDRLSRFSTFWVLQRTFHQECFPCCGSCSWDENCCGGLGSLSCRRYRDVDRGYMHQTGGTMMQYMHCWSVRRFRG